MTTRLLPLGILLVLAPTLAAQEPAGPPEAPPEPEAPVAPAPATEAAPAPPATSSLPPPEVRGMALPLHAADVDFDYGPLLVELPSLGVTDVCLHVKLFQERADSPAPSRRPLKTTSDRALLRTMRQARALGLQVTLLPLVLLERPGPDDWRGNLRPPDWDVWFAGYEREVLHYARLAEEAEAAVFVVGSELSSTERRVPQWRRLIGAVRKVFSGELTYSANWDHYRSVSFWYLLDAIGLSGYYELSRSRAPSPGELEASWREVRRRLEAWRRSQGYAQRFLFLEVGYASLDGAARHPWDYTAEGPVDLAEQRDCYEAFARAWGGAPTFAGVFFYEWWGAGGPEDAGYTPRGKPAAEVIRRWFTD